MSHRVVKTCVPVLRGRFGRRVGLLINGVSLAASRVRILFCLGDHNSRRIVRGSVRRAFGLAGPAIAKVVGQLRTGNFIAHAIDSGSTHSGDVRLARGDVTTSRRVGQTVRRTGGGIFRNFARRRLSILRRYFVEVLRGLRNNYDRRRKRKRKRIRGGRGGWV